MDGSPYRPLPVEQRRQPRQTWWGRFAFVRRWLGGRWELRAYSTVVAVVDVWTRWVRVLEHSENESWRDGSVKVVVLGRQFEDGHVTWTSPIRSWQFAFACAWKRARVRRAIGGRWEKWHQVIHGTPALFDLSDGVLEQTRWIPVNAWTRAADRRSSATVVEREWYSSDGERRNLVCCMPDSDDVSIAVLDLIERGQIGAPKDDA